MTGAFRFLGEDFQAVDGRVALAVLPEFLFDNVNGGHASGRVRVRWLCPPYSTVKLCSVMRWKETSR